MPQSVIEVNFQVPEPRARVRVCCATGEAPPHRDEEVGQEEEGQRQLALRQRQQLLQQLPLLRDEILYPYL